MPYLSPPHTPVKTSLVSFSPERLHQPVAPSVNAEQVSVERDQGSPFAMQLSPRHVTQRFHAKQVGHSRNRPFFFICTKKRSSQTLIQHYGWLYKTGRYRGLFNTTYHIRGREGEVRTWGGEGDVRSTYLHDNLPFFVRQRHTWPHLPLHKPNISCQDGTAQSLAGRDLPLLFRHSAVHNSKCP